MKKHFYIVGVFCLLASFANGQKAYKVQKKQKNNYEAYPNPFDFRPNGWLFDAGLTGTFPTTTNSSPIIIRDSNLTLGGQIRPGITLNVGRYQSLKKGHKLIKYIDYNLGYKMLWNNESQNITVNNQDVVHLNNLNNTAHYINANFNLNNLISFSDYLFLQNSLGINLDYRFAHSLDGSGINEIKQPDAFILQGHYKLGFGIMIDNNIALIPYVEIPVFNLSPNQQNLSQLDYFNQSYQSFIIGARLMLFRLGQKECPKARGVGLDPNQKNGY